jgi:NADH-quinone oxidoreductase subunit K
MYICILTSIILLVVGFIGIFLSRKNLILILMSIEVVLLALELLTLLSSTYLDNMLGYLIIFYILTIAAAETAIGLAFIIVYHKIK